MRCFCGCETKVRRGMRAINKRGAMIDGDLSDIRMLLKRGMQSPSAETYVHDGEILCRQLADDRHQLLRT